MSDKPLSALAHALQGQCCIVEKRENDWVLRFGGHCSITVSVPWRIVYESRIAFADSDDGQKFGLPQPIDGQTAANALLRDKPVLSIEHDRPTANLHLHFAGETRIDLFNNPSGYEGWQAEYSSGEASGLIIGLGGGDVAIFYEPTTFKSWLTRWTAVLDPCWH